MAFFNIGTELNNITARILYVQNKWRLVADSYGSAYEVAYSNVNEALGRDKTDDLVARTITLKFLEIVMKRAFPAQELILGPILAGLARLLGNASPTTLPRIKVPGPLGFKTELSTYVGRLFDPILAQNVRLTGNATRRNIGEDEFWDVLDMMLRSSIWYPPPKVGILSIRMEWALWTLYMVQLTTTYSGGSLAEVFKGARDSFLQHAINSHWDDIEDPPWSDQNHDTQIKQTYQYLLRKETPYFNSQLEQMKQQDVFIPQSSVPANYAPRTASYGAKIAPGHKPIPAVNIKLTPMLTWRNVDAYPWP